MTPVLEHPSSHRTTPPPRRVPNDLLPRNKAGEIKHRFSWEEKLRILDPNSSIEVTEQRLEVFGSIFCFWLTNGIITKVGQGPREWRALRGRIYGFHVVRHLLANHVPTLEPQWIGARNYPTTRYVCIDVDTVRMPEQGVLRQAKPQKPKPPFADRCHYVEDILRRVGIDPEDPFQVLIQPTPSGGRHYYFFLDQSYHPETPLTVLKDAGLKHISGQFELFPSKGLSLRLPFGHIPGQPHDPKAWIRFIDAYRFGRIRRFSVTEMYDALERHHRPIPAPPKQIRTQPRTTHVAVMRQAPLAGIPKRERPSIERFLQLVNEGPGSTQDAQELINLGILLPANRTKVLNHLAAHLIWFRDLPADEAAEQLTTWAYTDRHASKDIADDLEGGTRHVAKHITTMCNWYAEHKKPRTINARPLFATAELTALRPHIQTLPPEERTNQAHFLLSFLRFAKLHGNTAQDNSGWEAAPAINAVVKKWDGCRHGNVYKKRIDHAEAAGLLKMTRQKWQNHHGPGRARTYRLTVPVVPREEWYLDYDQALALVTGAAALEPTPPIQGTPTVPVAPNETQDRSTNHDRSPNHDRADGTNSGPGPTRERNSSRGDYPAPLRPPCPGADVEPGPRERTTEPDAAIGVPGPANVAVAAVPAATVDQTIPAGSGPTPGLTATWQPLLTDPEERKRHEETKAAVQELVDDPALPQDLRRILTTDPEQRTDAEVKVCLKLVQQQRRIRAERSGAKPTSSPPTYTLPKRDRLAMEAEARWQQRHPTLQGVPP